jgi:hypothetical protein
MMGLAIALAAAASGAACKGKGKGTGTSLDAAPVTSDRPGGIDARPWFAIPDDARVLGKKVAISDLPDLGGAGATGSVQLMMVDVPVGRILPLLQTWGSVVVRKSDDKATITGRATALDRGKLLEALHTAQPDVIPEPVKRTGTSAEVDLAFTKAPAKDVFRIIADVEIRNYVLDPTGLPDVDIMAKNVPADVVATELIAAVGYTADHEGNVTFVHPASATPLDQALIKLKGPVVDVEANGARAGELYAALAEVGAKLEGGAGCDSGEPVTVRLKHVKAGLAVAAIAKLSSTPPAAGAACTLTDAYLGGVTKLRAVVTAGKRRLAIVGDNTAPGWLDSKKVGASTIGTTYLSVDYDTWVELFPPTPTPYAGGYDYYGYGTPPSWAADLPRSRLGAILTESSYRKIALIELPDGTWQTLDSDDYRLTSAVYYDIDATAGTVKFRVSSQDYSKPAIEGTLEIRHR